MATIVYPPLEVLHISNQTIIMTVVRVAYECMVHGTILNSNKSYGPFSMVIIPAYIYLILVFLN